MKTWGKRDVPEWNAIYGLSFFMFLNIYTVLMIALAVVDEPLPELNSLKSKAVLIAFAVLILLTNYISFVRKRKYKTLVIEFGDKTKAQRIKGTYSLLVYVIVSFALPIFIAILLQKP